MMRWQDHLQNDRQREQTDKTFIELLDRRLKLHLAHCDPAIHKAIDEVVMLCPMIPH